MATQNDKNNISLISFRLCFNYVLFCSLLSLSTVYCFTSVCMSLDREVREEEKKERTARLRGQIQTVTFLRRATGSSVH